MSATSAFIPVPIHGKEPVEFARLLKAEWRKIHSLKFWWVLITVPLFITALSTVTSLVGLANVQNDETDYRQRYGDMAFTVLTGILGYTGFLAAFTLTILFCAVFAGINTAGEFQHRTISTTYATARSRDRVIAVKLLVTTIVGVGYGLVLDLVVVIATLLLEAFNSDTWTHSRGIPFSTVLLLCLASMFVAVAWTWIGAGLGLLTGSTLATTIAQSLWSYAGEPLIWLMLLFVSIGSGGGLFSVARVLPVMATGQTLIGAALLTQDTSSDHDHAAVMLAYGVPALLFWAGLSLGLGWWRARTRDIT